MLDMCFLLVGPALSASGGEEKLAQRGLEAVEQDSREIAQNYWNSDDRAAACTILHGPCPKLQMGRKRASML
jgi:uncharacterized protein YciI